MPLTDKRTVAFAVLDANGNPTGELVAGGKSVTLPKIETSSDGGVVFSDLKNVSKALDFADVAINKPFSPISDAAYVGWTKTSGQAGSSIEQSPVSGFAVRLTTALGTLQYVVAQRPINPLLTVSGDILTFVVNVPDANNTRNIRINLLGDSGGTSKAYIVTGNFHPGRNVVAVKIDDFIFVNSTVDTQWNYLQFDLTGPTYNKQLSIDVGPTWVGGAARVPMVCIGCDTGYQKVYDWLFPMCKAAGIVANVYAMPSAVGTGSGQAQRMTAAQHAELYAAGWDIGLYVNADNMGANNHTKTGVTTDQSVGAGASFSIDGTYAAGGVATLDVPRVVTAYMSSGSESSNSFTITGTDASGAAISESITGPVSSLKSYTVNKFATVTGIVAQNATSAAVSFGTAFTQEEYLAQFALQKAWLDSNSFTRGWAHFAYALGEFNGESESWVRKAGFKTARTTATYGALHRNGSRVTPNNNLFVSCAVTLGDPSSFANIQTAIEKAIGRGQDIMALAHLGGAVVPDQAELGKTIAYLAKLHRAGTIRIVSFSQWEAVLGL